MSRPLSFVVLLALFSSLLPRADAAVLVTNGASWKYFIGTQEASTPINAWRQIGFDDGSWQSGFAPIGYPSDPPNDPGGYEGTIRTTLPTSTAGNYLTVFLRKTFTVSNPADLAQQVRSHQPGDQVTITYSRAGNSTDAQVQLGDRSAQNAPAS